MKKYNKLDKKWLLLGILIPFLLFSLTFSMAYSFFTATANQITINRTASIICIGSENTIKSIQDNASIAPGDTLTLQTRIKNVGTAPIYCFLKFDMIIGESSAPTETIQKFYTFSEGNLVEFSTSNILDSFILSSEGTTSYKDVVINYNFDALTYTNYIMGQPVNYTLTAYSIQTDCIESASAATQILLNNYI